MPQAIMCVECGASFQRKFPATLAVFIACVLIVTLAGTGYFMAHSSSSQVENNTETGNTEKIIDSPVTIIKDVHPKNSEVTNTISNNIPDKLLRKKNAAILKLTKNILPENVKDEKPAATPVVTEKVKEKIIPVPPVDKEIVPSGRISTNSFSSRELRSYSVGCSYYEGRSKNNIVFFTTNVYGYAKINGKMYALQGVQKTNDIARFAGAGYEVTIEIEGLSGNEMDWVAAGTMTVKDIRQRTLSKHKIYSTCTDF